MSDFNEMTEAQKQALITPAMQALMTPAMQAQLLAMTKERVALMQQMGVGRLPVDASGKAFTFNAPCTIVAKQRTDTQTVIPTRLIGVNISVIGTAGERVRVRFPNGEERDFHQSELGLVV